MVSRLHISTESQICIGVIIFLSPLFIWLTMVVHDQFIVIDKAHDNWYNAWKNDITNEDSCVMLQNLIDDEQGKWLHSELYPLVIKRMGELKC